MSPEQVDSAPSSAESRNVPYWNNNSQWPQQQQGVREGNNLHQTNENNYLSGIGVQSTEVGQSHSSFNYYENNRKEVSSVSSGFTYLVFDGN